MLFLNYRITELVHLRSFSPYKRIGMIYRFTPDYYTEKKTLKILHDMSNSVIKTRKIQLKEEIAKMAQRQTVPEGEDQFQVKGKIAFLDMLLLSKTSEGEPLSDQMIREEVDTFMFEVRRFIFVIILLKNIILHLWQFRAMILYRLVSPLQFTHWQTIQKYNNWLSRNSILYLEMMRLEMSL